MFRTHPLKRDYRDIVGGALLVVVGLWFSSHAIGNYDLGTVRRMGPGMFPAGLGIPLAILGVMQMIPAFFRRGEAMPIRIWSPLFVLGGVVAFAVMVRPFGLIPAIMAVTIISSLAELKFRPVSLTILCTSLCLIAWLTFRVALNMPFVMWNWPF